MNGQPMESFLSKLIDWKGFEQFVANMYQNAEEVEVLHNVTEIGVSGAKRQIDVLVLQKSKLHIYKTIIECKFWKDKVSRDRIDVLAAAITDLRANKGVMFTTQGYEEGAINYARDRNIDIFIVRDVLDGEWGKPGRFIWLYLQTYSAQIEGFQLTHSGFVSTKNIPPPVGSINIGIYIGKDMVFSDEYNLCSFPELKRGPNLLKLVCDIRTKVLSNLSNSINARFESDNFEMGLRSNVIMDFQNYPFRYLPFSHGYIKLDTITMSLLQSITQKKIEHDRAEKTDFVLMVENYITKQKNFAFKEADEDKVELSDPLVSSEENSSDEIVANGSIMKVTSDYWIGVSLSPNTRIRQTEDINVNIIAPN